MPKAGLDALLTPENSAVVLIDHQPFQFANLHSHEPAMVANNVVGLAKAAKAFNVPTILTTVLEDLGRPQGSRRGEEDRAQAVGPGGALDRSLAMPAIQAAGEGYDVFAVTDASGGVSHEAHDMAVRRMVAAGVTPITWLAVASEWQRDWAREATASALGDVFAHAGGSGIAFAWEMQLLGHKAR